MQTVDNKGWIRWASNILCLIGYYLLIHNSVPLGLALKGVADLGIIAWGSYNKLWDVVGVTAIFCYMNFQRLSEIIELQSLLHLCQQSAVQLFTLT